MNDSKFIIDITKAYLKNINLGIKYCEIAIQKVIEEEYNCVWWQVCTLSIFNELMEFEQTDPIFLADKILKNIKENVE